MDTERLLDALKDDLVRALRPDDGNGREKWCECKGRSYGVGERVVYEDGTSPRPDTLCLKCGHLRPVRVVSSWQCWQYLLVDLSRRLRSYELYTRTDPPHCYARWTGMTREEQGLLGELVRQAETALAVAPDDKDALDVVRVGGRILDGLPIFEPDPNDESLPEYVRWAAASETPCWVVWSTDGAEFGTSEWRQVGPMEGCSR